MNPPTEQLIRDYLNRVSVAARGRLGAEDRRAFLARTREFIEQNTRALGHTDSTDVLKLLSDLGDPAALVDRERDRLADQRTGAAAGDSASGARSGKARRRRPARGSLADLLAARAAAVPPGQAVHVPEPAPDVPLTGELQFQTRPITSRWRPGAPMVPKPPRQRRAGIPRRLQPGGLPSDGVLPGSLPSDGVLPGSLPSDALPQGNAQAVFPPPGNAQAQPAAGEQPAEAADQHAAGSPPPLPADVRPRLRRPEWPLLSPRRPDTSGTDQANGQPFGGDGALSNGQAVSNGAPPNGTVPKGPQPGVVPAQWTPLGGAQPGAPRGAQPGGGLPNGAWPAEQRPSATQPAATDPDSVSASAAETNGTATAQAQSADLPHAGGTPGGLPAGEVPAGSAPSGDSPPDEPSSGGVSSSDLVAGRAPGSRRLAAVARGTGWASGVRARGARSVGSRGARRGAGVHAGSGRSGRSGSPVDGESASQPRGPATEEPLSGLWPDLGPIGAGAGRLARTVLARARRHPLEATAVVLLGLGGLIYPPVWLMGAVVALVSRVWDFRDKWIGLAVPVFLVIVGVVADVSLGGTRHGLSGYAKEAWVFGSHISRVAAVLGAIYLAWRAERGRRSPPVPPWNKPHRFG